MRINDVVKEDFRSRMAGAAQTKSTARGVLKTLHTEMGRRGMDFPSPWEPQTESHDDFLSRIDPFLTFVTDFLESQGFENADAVRDQIMRNDNVLKSSSTQDIAKEMVALAAQTGNQYRGDIKIPAEIIDSVKKLNLSQRQLLGRVLLGQTRAQ